MKQRLDLTQKQLLSTHLIQSMEILQMSMEELDMYLAECAAENPVISLNLSAEEDPVRREIKRIRKQEWLSQTDYQNQPYYHDTSEQDTGYSPSHQYEPISRESYLLAQAPPLSEYDRRLLTFLIHSLDDNGYFTEDPETVARLLETSENHVDSMLGILQSLEPAGIGARNIAECLLLQITRIPTHSPLAEELIREHLPALSKHHLRTLAEKLHVPLAHVKHAWAEIRSLDPRPGLLFAKETAPSYIIPDAYLHVEAANVEILINERSHPSFTFDPYYLKLAKETADPQTKTYLKEKIRAATEIQKRIESRANTIVKILHVMANAQRAFFLEQAEQPQPLSLADIARETGYHPSTISRAIRGKYLQCDIGIFPFQFFLVQTAATERFTGIARSPQEIKAIIRELIEKEDKQKPLSDEDIAKALADREIPLSRRTVNKYRQELCLPDKSGRKKSPD